MTMQSEPQKGIRFSTTAGATIALRCSNNGFKSRLALRLVKAAMRPTRLFAKKRTCKMRAKQTPEYR